MTAPYPQYDGTQPCGANPEVFFPDPRNSYYALIKAREICTPCPFRAECRAYALDHDVVGYWAATSFIEREKERASLGVTPVPVTLTESELRAQLIDELDDGTRTDEQIAGMLRCSQKTVERYLHAKHGYRVPQRRAVA